MAIETGRTRVAAFQKVVVSEELRGPSRLHHGQTVLRVMHGVARFASGDTAVMERIARFLRAPDAQGCNGRYDHNRRMFLQKRPNSHGIDTLVLMFRMQMLSHAVESVSGVHIMRMDIITRRYGNAVRSDLSDGSREQRRFSPDSGTVSPDCTVPRRSQVSAVWPFDIPGELHHSGPA